MGDLTDLRGEPQPTPWWPQGLQNWNMDGFILPSTVKPQPTLKNPGLYWIQDEENQWHIVDPRNYQPAPQQVPQEQMQDSKADALQQLAQLMTQQRG